MVLSQDTRADLSNKEFEEKVFKYQTFLDKYEKVTKETLDEMNIVHGPYWKARDTLARLLITVSATILALTVTFSSTNLAKKTLFILLFSEWISLVVSVLFCLIGLWFSMKISSIHIHFSNQQSAVLQKVKKMLEHGHFEKEFFEGLFSAPFKDLGKNDKRSWVLLRCGLVSFILSLFLLCVIGWASLPSCGIK